MMIYTIEEISVQSKEVLIVGAGISGLTMALLLSKIGFRVVVAEKREKKESLVEDERSINLTISTRGLKTLREIGIEENVLAKSCKLDARVVHLSESERSQHLYNNINEDSYFGSIRRSDLIEELLRRVSEENNIKVLFSMNLINIDLYLSKASFCSNGNKILCLNFDFIVGADGSYSEVRNYIISRSAANFKIKFFAWVYKKVNISIDDSIKMNLNNKALHIWPNKNSILFALPNLDNTFSCIYCLNLANRDHVDSMPNNNFIQQAKIDIPYLYEKYPSIKESIALSKSSNILSSCISKWFYKDKIILIGDACHSVFPFYGQGMNAALEDCLYLYNCLKESKDSVLQAFIKYEIQQKPNGNALVELSEKHFYSLQKSSKNVFYESRVTVDNLLNKLFFNKWYNEHSLVTDGRVGYKDIKKVFFRRAILRFLLGLFILDFMMTIFIILKRTSAKYNRNFIQMNQKIWDLRKKGNFNMKNNRN
jgi:kynurenine 3-monooxygenase